MPVAELSGAFNSLTLNLSFRAMLPPPPPRTLC